MGKELVLPALLHGGDYNPEQWLHRPDILEKDIEYFKKAKINAVSIGMFSWAVLEPEEGEFHFEWMHEIIDRMYENGIYVILATPSGARPKWLADKYPEVLRVDANRQRNLFGARHNHCYTSPIYREKIRRINMELAKRFGNHPAVLMWHISNEFGGACHCPLCQEEFRRWLKEKYKTIENLNECWCTTFWSHIYQSFEQIESPSPRGEMGLHGLNLDWKRFVTDRTIDFLKHEVKALRDAGSDKPVTANLMYDYVGLDYHKFKDAIDIVSWDNYPTWHKGPEYLTALDAGMQHDLMRSIQKKPFLLMESCPSATNWQKVSKLKRPGMLEAASLQAVAHGSDSVLYFQLRQSQGASEKFHGAVIDHYGGDDTRVFKEVTKVGEALEKLKEVRGSVNIAEAAVIYDWDNRWAMKDSQGPRNDNLFYKECVQKSYNALRRMGINVDVIGMDHEFMCYKMIAAPMQYLFHKDFAEKVREFVAEGGTFVMTYWSGVVDESDRCFLGGTPHGLMDVFGLRSAEIDGLYDGEVNHAVPVYVELAEKESVTVQEKQGIPAKIQKTYECRNLCELVEVSTAEVLMTYGEDFYAGNPAFTRNKFGKGTAYYVCADMEEAFYNDIYPKIAGKSFILPVLKEIPQGIEVTERQNEKQKYIFVQNFNYEKTKIMLPVEEYEILYGDYDGAIEGFGTVVLKKSIE